MRTRLATTANCRAAVPTWVAAGPTSARSASRTATDTDDDGGAGAGDRSAAPVPHAASTTAAAAATRRREDGEVITGAAGYVAPAARPFERHPTVLRPISRLLVVLLAVGFVVVAAVGTSGAREVIRVTVTPGSVTSPATESGDNVAEVGVLRLTPTLQVQPDSDLVWTLNNETSATVSLDLALRRLARTITGAVAATGPPVDVVFESNPVVLVPGATARLSLPGGVAVEDLGAGVGLVASSTSLADELTGLVLARRGAPDEVLTILERTDGRLTGRVELRTDEAIVVDLRARLVAWPSRVVTDRTVSDVVVLPPGRAVELELAGTAFVGPVDLDVVAGAGADAISSSARAWIVNRIAVRTIGSLVLAVTVVLLGTALLRRRRGRRS